MHIWALLLVILSVLVFAQGQTATITVPGGPTVVIDIIPTTGANGTPLTTTTTLRTFAAVPTPDHVNGVPPTGPPGTAGPIIYYVTTYDEDGNTIINTYTYTPTFAPSSALQTSYSDATVYDYQSWTAQFATHTAYPNSAASSFATLPLTVLGLIVSSGVFGMALILI